MSRSLKVLGFCLTAFAVGAAGSQFARAGGVVTINDEPAAQGVICCQTQYTSCGGQYLCCVCCQVGAACYNCPAGYGCAPANCYNSQPVFPPNPANPNGQPCIPADDWSTHPDPDLLG